MTVPGGARAAEGTAMPSGRLGWGREPPPRSEPRSRAARTAPRAPPPAALCPRVSASGREMITCPLHLRGGAARSASVVPRLTGCGGLLLLVPPPRPTAVCMRVCAHAPSVGWGPGRDAKAGGKGHVDLAQNT